MAGTAATLTLIQSVPDCPPPGPCGDFYSIQSCDVLTWTFGDGTPSVVGSQTITHTWASPGVYHPSLTIANSLGSIQIPLLAVVASNPPTYVDFSPSNITVPETAGSITFTLVRSGNLNTTATVHYRDVSSALSGDVTFAPGETTKSFTRNVVDDHAYGGDINGTVVATATDGTVFHGGIGRADYTVTETDPRPTATVADAIVREGETTADVVVTVSGPFAFSPQFWGITTDGTAKEGSDYIGPVYCSLPPGATQCVLHFPIVDDNVPEPDKTFTVKVYALPGPIFLRDTATVTIVDDDAALTPASIQVTTGMPVSLKLDIRQAAATNMVIPLHSSSPEVVEVPASVTVAAGQSSATFTARTLQAGRARITANVPGVAAPVAAISVVDAVAIAAEPLSLKVSAGTDGTVKISLRPPSAAAQTVTLWSTRPEVVTVPESLTIPAGGSATVDVHAIAAGAATIWIVTADGFLFPVDVTVVPPRRRATR